MRLGTLAFENYFSEQFRLILAAKYIFKIFWLNLKCACPSMLRKLAFFGVFLKLMALGGRGVRSVVDGRDRGYDVYLRTSSFCASVLLPPVAVRIPDTP